MRLIPRLSRRLVEPLAGIAIGWTSRASAMIALSVSSATGYCQTSALPEKTFNNDMEAAMATMDDHMMVKPTGDPDKDFVQMMIPHHQGAIDMAIAELRYGRDERLKRIAQEIIVDQQQEIAAMCLALGQPLPPSTPSPTHPSIAPDHAGMHAGKDQ